MIHTIITACTDLDMLIATFQKIFCHKIAAAFIVQSDIQDMVFLICIKLTVCINGNDRFVDQLIDLFAVAFAEGNGNNAVYIPAHDHLEDLICILCGIQHQIISQLLHVFLDKTDDLSIKRISDDRILEIFMIIDHNCDQLGFFFIQNSQSHFLDISHFPDKILDLLNVGRRYFFCFSMYDVGNSCCTYSCSLRDFLNRCHYLSSRDISVRKPLHWLRLKQQLLPGEVPWCGYLPPQKPQVRW